VRNLVELHGGSVTATSDGVGKGSTFTVLLPLASASERANAPAQSVPPPEKPVDGDGKRRVVIVEDNPDLRELLRMKLRRLGHDVDAASDGHDGLAMLLEQKPDVAFVDIGLPGIDGYEIAQKVRESLGERVLLVALSGFGQPDDKRKALEAGFDQHLTKPAEIADIERVLESAPR
jgi:CheY-like chemotaxis protein